MNIKVEKGIEIPARGNNGSGTKWKSLLVNSENGDSFLISRNQLPTIRSTAFHLKIKIVTRKQEGDIFRVWITK